MTDPPPTLRQSVGFVEFFSSLAGGAIVIWITWRIAEAPMANMSNNAQLEEVRRSVRWTELLLNNLPAIFLLTAVVGSIAFAVFQTRYS